MSTMALVKGRNGVVAAWETERQIYFANLEAGPDGPAEPQSAPGDGGDRKHPVLAFDARGRMILVWTEGTGWNQGGALAWQVYDPAGKLTAGNGREDGAIPVWGLPAVAATAEGFTIFH